MSQGTSRKERREAERRQLKASVRTQSKDAQIVTENLSIKRTDVYIAVAVAVGLFGLYIFTMPATVTLEDSGLFITTAYFAGIAHQPGYPLYTMIGKLFTLLPVGAVATRVHLFSALSASGACSAVYFCGRFLNYSRIISAAVAVLLGVSLTFWSQAIIAEVYSFHALFFFSVLALSLYVSQVHSLRLLYVIMFVVGLSLSNHWPLMLLAAPGIAILLALPLLRELKQIPKLFGVMLLGLTPYLYLVIRSTYEPYINAQGLIQSLDDFVWYVTRQAYKNIEAGNNWVVANAFQFILHFFRRLIWEFSPVGFIFFISGLVVSWFNMPRRIFLALAAAFLGSTVLLVFVMRLPFELHTAEGFLVYQLAPFGVAALFAGASLQALSARFAGTRASWIAVAAVLVVSCTCLGLNFRANDRRSDTVASDFARAVLETLPHDSTLVLTGDLDFGPLIYTNLVEKFRPDVTLRSAHDLVLGNRLFPVRSSRRASKLDGNALIVARFEKILELQKRLFVVNLPPELQEPLAKIYDITTNHLTTEIMIRGLPPTKFTDAVVQSATLILDRQAAGAYSASWANLRKNVYQKACMVLWQNKISHPAFQTIPVCQRIHAWDVFVNGQNFFAAQTIYRNLLDRVDPLYFTEAEWTEVNQFYFAAKVNVIKNSAESSDAKSQKLDQLLGEMRPYVYHSKCSNLIMQDLRTLGASHAPALKMVKDRGC